MVQAAVTTTTAARFGLRVGTRLNAGPVPAGGHRDHPARAPGFRLLDRGSRGGHARADAGRVGRAVVLDRSALHRPRGAPARSSPPQSPVMNATWWYPAALGRLTAGQAGGLEASLGSLVSSGVAMTGDPDPVTATSRLPDSLDPVAVHRRGKRRRPRAGTAVRQPGRHWARWWCCSAPGWWRSAAPWSSRSCEPGARRCTSSAGWCCGPAWSSPRPPGRRPRRSRSA